MDMAKGQKHGQAPDPEVSGRGSPLHLVPRHFTHDRTAPSESIRQLALILLRKDASMTRISKCNEKSIKDLGVLPNESTDLNPSKARASPLTVFELS